MTKNVEQYWLAKYRSAKKEQEEMPQIPVKRQNQEFHQDQHIFQEQQANILEKSSSQSYLFDLNAMKEIDNDLGNTLWSYGENGLELWFPFYEEKDLVALKMMGRDRYLEFDLEVYPVGFVSSLGIIVGISQQIIHAPNSLYYGFQMKLQVSDQIRKKKKKKSTSLTTNFFIDAKMQTHPFLYTILHHLIENGLQGRAYKIAKHFQSIPHFSHCLELLLFETLEETVERNQNNNNNNNNNNNDNNNNKSSDSNFGSNQRKEIPKLERVISFLRNFNFGLFCELVMRCARKTDPVVWKTLMDPIGSPSTLFEVSFFIY